MFRTALTALAIVLASCASARAQSAAGNQQEAAPDPSAIAHRVTAEAPDGAGRQKLKQDLKAEAAAPEGNNQEPIRIPDGTGHQKLKQDLKGENTPSKKSARKSGQGEWGNQKQHHAPAPPPHLVTVLRLLPGQAGDEYRRYDRPFPVISGVPPPLAEKDTGVPP